MHPARVNTRIADCLLVKIRDSNDQNTVVGVFRAFSVWAFDIVSDFESHSLPSWTIALAWLAAGRTSLTRLR
jgi:hypothetical protein